MENTTQRPTTEMTTPNGHKVVVFAYATGGDSRKWQEAMYEGLMLKPDEKMEEMSIENIPAHVIIKMDTKAVELMVVSVDGATDDIQRRVDELQMEDYDAVIGAVRGFFGKRKTA